MTIKGKGPLNAKLMIIVECPGQDEMEAGEPLVGRAGKLLTSIMEQAQIQRETTYITNVVKEPCRDGNKNRPPKQEEIDKWKGGLWEEIKLLKELKLIVTLGKIPTCLLLKLKSTIKLTDYFGKRYKREYMTANIVPCYHPSFLLQNGADYTEQTKKLFRGIRRIINE